jgi:hypothetical protein
MNALLTTITPCARSSEMTRYLFSVRHNRLEIGQNRSVTGQNEDAIGQRQDITGRQVDNSNRPLVLARRWPAREFGPRAPRPPIVEARFLSPRNAKRSVRVKTAISRHTSDHEDFADSTGRMHAWCAAGSAIRPGPSLTREFPSLEWLRSPGRDCLRTAQGLAS